MKQSLLLSIIGLTCSQAVLKANAPVVPNCEICGLTFRRLSEYETHVNGNRHRAQLAKSSSHSQLWNEFQNGASNWAEGCNGMDVIKVWNADELSTLNLKFRKTCLHPSPVVGSLEPYQRARVWRYVRDAMGMSHYSEIASIFAHAEKDTDGHLRVKELFESFEAYKSLVSFVIAAQKTSQISLRNIVEVACGHGLVGLLLAYRFPNLMIHLYDLHKRPTFEAFLRSFEANGIRREGCEKVLPNIIFHEEDLKYAKDNVPGSIVVCMHGCGEVNNNAIEMALDNNAVGYMVMPCCIKNNQDESLQVHLSDDITRYNLLCGALANQYDAQLVVAIDARITNRPIMIAGGVGRAFRTDSIHTSAAGGAGATLSSEYSVTKNARVRAGSAVPPAVPDDGFRPATVIDDFCRSGHDVNNSGTTGDFENSVKRKRLPRLQMS